MTHTHVLSTYRDPPLRMQTERYPCTSSPPDEATTTMELLLPSRSQSELSVASTTMAPACTEMNAGQCCETCCESLTDSDNSYKEHDGAGLPKCADASGFRMVYSPHKELLCTSREPSRSGSCFDSGSTSAMLAVLLSAKIHQATKWQRPENLLPRKMGSPIRTSGKTSNLLPSQDGCHPCGLSDLETPDAVEVQDDSQDCREHGPIELNTQTGNLQPDVDYTFHGWQEDAASMTWQGKKSSFRRLANLFKKSC